MKHLDKDVIKALKDYPAFTTFMDLFIESIQELKTLDETMLRKSDSEAGQDAKSKYLAAVLIEDLFSQIMNHKDPIKPTDDDLKSSNKRYGLE